MLFLLLRITDTSARW